MKARKKREHETRKRRKRSKGRKNPATRKEKEYRDKYFEFFDKFLDSVIEHTIQK